ncbi:Fc.00g054100.m01.CDS01 [Cosmosporella sp. VM-42]
MLGTSFTEWILIRACIVLFRYTPLLYTAGLLILFLLYGTAAINLLGTWILCALILTEGLFFTFLYRPYEERLKRDAEHPSPLTPEERRALFDRCLISVPSPELYIQWWFMGADPEEIRRDNVKEFFLWAFFELDEGFNDHGDEDTIEQEINEFVSVFERRLGRKLKEGRGTAKGLRLTFDNIHTTYRSPLWYLIVFGIDLVAHFTFLLYGFEYYSRPRATAVHTYPPRPQELLSSRISSAQDLGYWHRPHSAEGQLPVVFFHGIGIGLWTYVKFLADIYRASKQGQGGIGIIAIEVLPISFRLCAPITRKAEFVDQMTAILNHHHWEKVALVSHSYGSVLVTHMLHSPELNNRVQSVVLIDPVTIMLHLPDVAYNFTRRGPKMANEWQLWYFASTDPGVAHCLGRHFFWRENIIWKDELLLMDAKKKAHRKVAVTLSGRDLIVNTAAVAEYLEGNSGADAEATDSGVEVLIFPKLDHAQVFDNPRERGRVIELIKSNCVLSNESGVSTNGTAE